MQFAAAGRIGLVDMIIPRLCLNSVALSGIRTTPSKNCSPGSFFTAGAAALHRLSLRFCTGHFGYGKHPGQLLPFALPAKWGMQCTRPAGGKCSRRRSAGQFIKGGLPACPWRRKHGSRNAGKSKGRFRRKSVWRWRKSRTQDFFHIMLARRVSRTETSLRNCAALSFICT